MKKVILTIVALLFLAACAQPEIETKPIKIGVAAPLTGPLSFFGEWMREGFELALEEVNVAGIDGRKVELIYEDTICLPKEATTALSALDAKDAVAMLGPFCGSEVQAAASWAEQNKKVTISPGNNFGKLSEYFFNTEHLIADESKFLADFAYQKGFRKIAIIGINNDWGQMHRDSFTNHFETLGGKVVAAELFNQDTETDFRTYLTKIKAASPDAIFIAFSRPALIINQIHELFGTEIAIFGERGLQHQGTLDVAGKNADGLLYSYPGKSTEITPTQQKFGENYKTKYSKEPHLVVAQSYDALKILAMALNACIEEQFSSDCLSNYVQQMKDYDGARGRITYEGTFWNMKIPFHMKMIKNGTFVQMEVKI